MFGNEIANLGQPVKVDGSTPLRSAIANHRLIYYHQRMQITPTLSIRSLRYGPYNHPNRFGVLEWYLVLKCYREGEIIGMPFGPESSSPECDDYIREWFDTNGITPLHIGQWGALTFNNGDDALLAYLAFK